MIDGKRPIDTVIEYNVSLMAKGMETEDCYKRRRQSGVLPREGFPGPRSVQEYRAAADTICMDLDLHR